MLLRVRKTKSVEKKKFNLLKVEIKTKIKRRLGENRTQTNWTRPCLGGGRPGIVSPLSTNLLMLRLITAVETSALRPRSPADDDGKAREKAKNQSKTPS